MSDFCRQAEQTARQLAADGITLSYHHHLSEAQKRGGVTMLDVHRAEAPTMQLELDVHWLQRSGLDPVRTLHTYAGVVDLVHLKDYRIGQLGVDAAQQAMRDGDGAGFMRISTGVVQFAEVGEGNLEWSEIIPASVEAGAEYLFIEQDDQYGRDPFDCLATSKDNLVGLGFGDLF